MALLWNRLIFRNKSSCGFRRQVEISLQFFQMDKENKKPQLDGSSGLNEHNEKTKNLRLPGSKKASSKNESYQLYMKYLIASNSQYFQNKIRVNQVGRTREIKFKVPSPTGMTIYKREFNKKQNKYHIEEGIKHNMSVDCIRTNNFLKEESNALNLGDKTVYQAEFKYQTLKTEAHRKLKKRIVTTTNQDDDAPRFFQTQNKIDFLNWAGKNYVPSMRPEQRPAVTHTPFEAKSMYKTDYDGKAVSPTPLFIRQPSLIKFGCSSPLMKTSYKDDYGHKKSGVNEIDCKPKHYEATLCKRFKGTTQYKREYVKDGREQRRNEQERLPTVQQLQTLIIDL